MDTVLSFILLNSEMLKIPSVKVEAYFLKKLGTRCLRKISKGNRKPSKILSSSPKLFAQIFLLSRIFYEAILLIELYPLPRCIAPYKQSLS